MRLRSLALLPLLVACSSSPGGTGGNGGGGAGGGAAAETCTATFRWLQKDAYKDTAGRTSALWPPHTTTALAVTCQTEGGAPTEIAAAFMANHGTEPDAEDANGDVILVETKRDQVIAPRAELLDLVAAYQACECDPATKFLSLDSLQDAAVQVLVQNVIGYLQAHLVCASPGGTDALVQALGDGDLATVLADLPSCTWDSGSDLAGGLDEALAAFLETTQEVLSEYHVCNNDASLQASLWQGFAGAREVIPCDGNKPVCHGPMWFYEP